MVALGLEAIRADRRRRRSPIVDYILFATALLIFGAIFLG